MPSEYYDNNREDCLVTFNNILKPCTLYQYSTGLLKNYLYAKTVCNLSQCPPNTYMCYRENYCISIDLICDGIKHCYLGDDEINCS